MQKHQNTQPATSAPVVVPQDETKAMLQQLLQGKQLQGKALNKVTTEINIRMNHMFSDLSTKYDNVASHMRQMDIQITQTAESVKRQQVKKRFTAAEKGKQKESELPPADTPAAEKEREPTVGTNSQGPEQPAEAVRPIPEPVPAHEYTPKVPYPVPAKATRKDREEMKVQKDAGGPNRPTPLDGCDLDDALHVQLYEGIDLRKNIRGERIHDCL
ncbi:hypothetical protein F2Q68_00031793 [Brassica cretica]|uniref:Uncharacterized protein n=1 Tax=Brassica cretica TaxID=69181 RepID=A0A8S9G8I8_BRACR|nr:hypothetical protein F2Q68_00031793 [Brassica cretica]